MTLNKTAVRTLPLRTRVPRSVPKSFAIARLGTARGRLVPQPTAVFDTYWQFAVERQEIFYRRLAGDPAPWTADELLGMHRFTNVYRASDRVSQYLIREVLYRGDTTPRETVFRTLLFKLFNRIETWELLAHTLGVTEVRTGDLPRLDRILTEARGAGHPIYSSAYIMPSASVFGSRAKHSNHLRLIAAMLADHIAEKLVLAKSLSEVFAMLREYPSIGNFLAYQLAIDLNYSQVLTFSELEFVVPGPGAEEGIRKCFANWHSLDFAAVIHWVTETQEDQLAARGLRLRSLWGRPLQLIDCQNLFCEVAKYSRVAHPEATLDGGRTRIKRRYTPSPQPSQPWFPPKWGINDRICGSTTSQHFLGSAVAPTATRRPVDIVQRVVT